MYEYQELNLSKERLDLARIRDHVRLSFPDVCHQEYAAAQRDPLEVFIYVRACLQTLRYGG